MTPIDNLVLVIPDWDFPSMNDFYEQRHWSARKAMADEAHLRVKAAVAQQVDEGVAMSGKVLAYIAGYRKRPYDADNIPSKLVIDGLRKAGVILDDTPEYVDVVISRSKPLDDVDSNPYMVVQLIAIQGEE